MEIVTKIAPICLALIMLGLGLGLSIKDFVRILKVPKDFFVGFFSQLVILPIVALGVALILNLPTPIAVGLMIIAAAPGGVTSNVLTKFANGDVALSISLTAVVSLISVITVPLIIYNSADFLGIEITKKISMLNIAVKMFVAVTIPVIFGMIVRALMTDYIVSKTLLVQRLSLILFLVIFTAIWVEEWNRIVSFLARAGLIALILNLTMIFLGYYLAKYLTSGVEQRKCISLECGLQNGTLAVFVGTQLFDNVVFMVPTAAYALIMFTTATIFVLIVRKIN